jgi:exopolyphosphatase/guanosine-5'-triphosphate,3'-diphosphate pyrophosphatase
VALGGDIRFAVSQVSGPWGTEAVRSIKVRDLARLAKEVLEKSIDELVTGYHITYPEAEGLGPALLTYLHVAKALGLDRIRAARATMRDGLLLEMMSRHSWSDQVQRQVIQSALEYGRKYQFDENHGTHVAVLCKTLFDALEDEHGLEPRHGLLLYVSALLHEVGLFISNVGHHKHSMYLIRNSELFGLGRKDILLVALVARYHRKATPNPSHEVYRALGRGDRIAVAKMAAILRVADALERSHHQHIQNIRCTVEPEQVIIEVPQISDLTLEQMALREKGNLFEEVYGRDVVLRTRSR